MIELTDDDRAVMRRCTEFPVVQTAYVAGIRAGMERAAKIADEAAEVSAGWANGADAAARLIREAAR